MAELNKRRCLLFGADGQLGFELRRSLGTDFELHAYNRERCDLSNSDAIQRVIRSVQPTVIVNAAAYTAVDRAESEPALAQAINADAVAVMAREAKALSAAFLHYSTDYVFSGEANPPNLPSKQGRSQSPFLERGMPAGQGDSLRPYTEADHPDPINAYGRSKLAGEIAVAEIMGNHCPWWIIRTSWVYGLHGSNFLKTMLKLAQTRDSLNVVADQIGAPTSAALIADISARLLQAKPASGIYHLTGAGQTSWHGFAKAAIAHARKQGLQGPLNEDRIRPITSAEYPTPAKRPGNSRLDCTKLEQALSIRLPDWQQTVELTVDDLLESGKV
jgi:dTDP-4-dehydrorhamnose reductase